MANDPTAMPLRRQVLLVEGHRVTLLMASRVLAAQGYCVATAACFRGALQAMTTCTVDAVVLDLELSDRSSMLLADEFIELGIPLVFASAGTDRLPARLGHAPLLCKPYAAADLVAHVGALFAKCAQPTCRAPAPHQAA